MATDSDARGNGKMIFRAFAKSKILSSSFTVRIAADWNSLPDAVVTATSVSCFKFCLDSD